MAASFPPTSQSCRYCLEDVSHLTEPKILPCTHVFCKPCLTRDLQSNDGVKCPVCGLVYFLSFTKYITFIHCWMMRILRVGMVDIIVLF